MNLREDNSGFIKRLFTRHVWPGVASQVVSTIGPIVCGMIAGTVFGKTGLAVTGLFSPLFFLSGFFGTIIAGGSATLAAKYIAQDDDRRVTEIYTLALILSAVCAAVLFALSMALRAPVLSLLAGTGELSEPAARNYLPSVLYMCLTVIVYMPLFWARLMGRPSVALVLTLTLAVVNIACAALFAFVLGLGLESLAVSQALATAIAIAVSMILLHLPENGLRVRRPRHIRDDVTALTAAGSPPGLSRLYRFASLFILNVILLNAAGTEAVAAFGVLNMLLRFVTAFSSGVSGVQTPIAGVLCEERDVTSLRQLARVMFTFGNAVIITAAALVLVFNRAVAALFGAVGEMFFPALLCFCVYIPFYMNGSLFVSWYTAIRRVKLANIVALAQDMLFPALFAALFSQIGKNSVWLHLPASGIATALLLPLLAAYARRSEREITVPLLLDKKFPCTALAFSVERDAVKAGEASAAVGGFCEEQGFDKRQSMLLSLAIEEMVALIAEQNAGGGDISVRLTRFESGVVMRLRDAGRKFNPIEYYQKHLRDGGDMEDMIGLMGVKYIAEAAEVVYYRETFGVNNLVVII